MIKVYVSRFNRGIDTEPHLECYDINETPNMKVLDALQAINEKYDADISFRSSCRAGQCGSCGILFNGNGALACQKEIKDGAIIEPLKFPVIKDLIVDTSSIEAKVKDLELSLQCSHECSELDSSITKKDTADTKKVRNCIECYSCYSTCPVVNIATEEFGGPYLMRYINKFDTDPRDNFDRLKEALDEGLYNCTSCGKCLSVCPKNINTFGDAIEKMRAIAVANGSGPLPKHVAFKENILKTGRSVKTDKPTFIEETKNKTGSKIAFFTGCMVDYKFPEVGHKLVKILKENGIDIDVPEGQVCCGSPLLRTGQTDIVQDLVDKNKEVFKDYDTIITVCSGCGATLKNNHPEFGSKLNVMDISEFLVDKLDESKLKDVNMTVTYHDPCHLARSQGIKDAPREIIEKIPGVEFKEMLYPCQCCGAGGGIKSGKPEIAMELAKSKAEMVKDTGADAVVTICPFCELNIQDGLNEIGYDNIKCIHILELLDKAYE
ncbi:fumarate reductase (CoM/CoB) subunit B [Methanobrevibacter gottschalkii]|uniref:Fumarate reductase (CoM/CoB) subunit B n=2 Tax=Methanobrevibacter gottschalkii TaxID=190974 RepID=A0A3N5BRQ0_9EURY|nr:MULTISPECIES: fumarate reductase (CoM/CoB) subunit TfrB [Methanobrevibacter]OEC94480.1 succinate dehydrogenase [Methanobrevibacter sp. A27]RPF50182.1 fumarate reductase (CoM/CoB) subunit B [Methanobrevibacter gottschalkii DSM 11977]SEL11858.1 fumarate reductase (CoM/CoB) subunit B [Methanobrevibacter gottschalkii]